MKVLISEQQLRRIITEQSSQQLISDRGYEAILEFENTKGTPNSDNTGATGMGYKKGDERQKETNIRNHINVTIGLNRWFKIPDLFRTQIYSFMFNSDSKSNDLFRWLSGLAQSINDKIDRSSITGKDINDPNVQNAIKLVNKTIDNGNINNYYNQYIKVLDGQYQSIMNSNTDTNSKGNKIVKPWFKAAYTHSWSVRPQEIEQYYNNPPSKKTTPVDKKTEPVDKVKSTPVDNTPVSDDNKNYDTLKINTPDLTSFIQEVRTKTQGLTVSLYSLKADITPDNCSFEILHAKPGAKDIQSTLKKIKRFTVALSTRNEGEAAADNILSKNPGSKVIRKGTFVENGVTRTWKLIVVI